MRSLRPPRLVVVPHEDYLYGVGTLRIRVSAVQADPQGEWVQVEGVEEWSTGREVGPRQVQVRAGTLRRLLESARG